MMRPEDRLLAAVRQSHAPHAVLLTGADGSDINALARRAAALYCTGQEDANALVNCPDYQELGHSPITVDDIRGMQTALIPRPFSCNRAIVLLQAHRMTEAAQNALLKTLEEPPGNTMLLLCGDERGLLSTIRSRCGIIRIPPMYDEGLLRHLLNCGYPDKASRLAVKLSGGAPLLAEQMVSETYHAFYNAALHLYESTVFAPAALPPYGDLQALLNTPPLPQEGEKRSKTERNRESGRHCLHIWQHAAREQLHGLLGMAIAFPLLPPKRRSMAGCFTIRQIQGIIDLILSAERRIGVANPQLTMDALLTALCMPADREGIII